VGWGGKEGGGGGGGGGRGLIGCDWFADGVGLKRARLMAEGYLDCWLTLKVVSFLSVGSM